MLKKKSYVKDHLKYWILPVVVLTIFMAMYFSGLKWAQKIICPTADRELGIVENIQLLFILLITIVSVAGVFRKKTPIEKLLFAFLALFSLFVFLEETDYGFHFLKYFRGNGNTFFIDLTGEIDIHDIGNNAKIFKRSIYPLMGLLFIVGPLFADRIKNKYLIYFIPNKWFISTAIVSIFSYLVPRFLVDFNIFKDGGFGVNIGEFSEMMIYYIFFLYMVELIYKKDLHIKQVSE
jgi:hypothetical protein